MAVKRPILLSLTLFICQLAASQPITRYNIFSYNVNEGLLQSTLADMAIDKNNFCWLSFPNGIQKFDGRTFTIVPVQRGLPDDKRCFFFKTAKGDLFVSHSFGISKYIAEQDAFRQVVTHTAVHGQPAPFIGEDGNTLYFFRNDASVVGLETESLRITSTAKTSLPGYASNHSLLPKISDNIVEHRTAFLFDDRLYLWDLQKGSLIAQSTAIPQLSIFLLRLTAKDEALFFTYRRSDALHRYQFRTGEITAHPVAGKPPGHISRCIVYPWKGAQLLSFNNRLFVSDPALQELQFEIVNFLNVAPTTSSIAKMKEDHFGNLFLQTISGGLRKIIRNNYPVKFYNTGKEGENNILSVLPDKKRNRILAGSFGNGLLVYDTLQNLLTQIKTLPGRQQPFSPNTILKHGNDYFLFCVSEKQVWKLSGDLRRLTPVPIKSTLPLEKSGVQFFSVALSQWPNDLVVQTQENLYRVDRTGESVNEHRIDRGYFMSGLRFGNSIVTHANDQLIFLDAASFIEKRRMSLKYTGNVRCFAKSSSGDVFYLGTNNGIFVTDTSGTVLRQLTRQNGLPDNCIYAIVVDEEGVLWCSSNKGLFRIDQANTVLGLTKADGLQENEFNTNVAAKADDGELFFGGVNGLSSFYPAAIGSFEDKPEILLTGLRINNEAYAGDSALWRLKKLELPHHKNSFSFDFTAMGSGNPDQYVYRYRMVGADKEWLQTTGPETIRYLLAPGEYRLQFYAARTFDAGAKALQELQIVIFPPYWKRWWFIASVIACFMALLFLFINQRNKRRFEKKLHELQAEQSLKEERERISRDLHDSLGAYAHALLYDIELLEKEKEEEKKTALIGELKFASKDIITTLRETVWALKKESYSAEECFVRISNFIQPLSRHYPHISFGVKGEVPTLHLHYTRALNLVRIVQEAVTNSIKHATPGCIDVKAATEQGRWVLTICDDGCGFDYELEKEATQGNGLLNMQTRATAAKFEFSAETTPGKGTCIMIKM